MTVRGEHRGWTNEREQVQGERGGYERARRTNEHKASAGITNKSEGVQTNTRDGTNEGEQVRTSAEGGTSTRRAYERAPGYERARGGTNAAGAVAGATHPSSPSAPPPLPPFFLFLYYSNIIYIFLYTCNTVF